MGIDYNRNDGYLDRAEIYLDLPGLCHLFLFTFICMNI